MARRRGRLRSWPVHGLLRRYISGHVETAKALLALAESDRLDLHVLPQGELVLLIEAQGAGRASLRSRTGVDTFLDPRCGPGSAICSRDDLQLIRAAGDELEYQLPLIDCALFSAAAADPSGNVYLTNMATLTETREAVRAARHNNGLVMAVVAEVCAEDPDCAPGCGRRRGCDHRQSLERAGSDGATTSALAFVLSGWRW